jgi:hypothetical protein
MNESIQLDPTEFFDFIARPEPTVLFLSVHPAHRFNHLLCDCFDDVQGFHPAAFGQLPLLALFECASPALSFLHREILACGASVPIAIPPGYYLFQQGQMLAWDSGLPATTDIKNIIRGSWLGAAITLLTRNLLYAGIALRSAARKAAAERVAFRFKRATASHRDNPRQAYERTDTTTDDLANAYRVLQVDPNASDDEVNRAWRTLQQKFHPDHAARDPDEFDRLSRRCVEINRARDIIRNHRKHRRQCAAAG